MRRAAIPGLTVLLALASACRHDLSSDRDARPAADALADAAAVDAAGAADGARDAAVVDAPGDSAAPGDAVEKADAPARPDATTAGDGPPADTTSGPCASGAGVTAGKVVVCTGAAVNQCQAHKLCGASWHVCTASEYRARVDATATFGVVHKAAAWIAGCVRDGNTKPNAPTDKVCKSCNDATINIGASGVSWACGSCATPSSSVYQHIGLRSHTACRTAGVCPGLDAMWSTARASQTLGAAVCCRD